MACNIFFKCTSARYPIPINRHLEKCNHSGESIVAWKPNIFLSNISSGNWIAQFYVSFDNFGGTSITVTI